MLLPVSTRRQCAIVGNTTHVQISAPHSHCTALMKRTDRGTQHVFCWPLGGCSERELALQWIQGVKVEKEAVQGQQRGAQIRLDIDRHKLEA